MVERLADHLGTWAGADPQRMAVAETVRIITDTCRGISVLVADGSLGQDLGAAVTENIQGETQKALDELANRMLIDACRGGPRGGRGVGRRRTARAGQSESRLLVAFDPLDGSSNIDINVSIGTIFSILPIKPGVDPASVEAFLQRGPQPARGRLRALRAADHPRHVARARNGVLHAGSTHQHLPPQPSPALDPCPNSGIRDQHGELGAIGRAPFRLTSTSASTARRDRGARTPTCAGSRRWSRTATAS